MVTVAEKEPIRVERRGNSTDRVTSITDERGITHLTNTYCSGSCPLDPAVATQTSADGGVYRFDYVVVNQSVMQATVTDPRGNKTVHRFNTRGHEIATVDAFVQQTRMTRDFTTNQVTEVRDPLNRLTKYTYDLSGNVNSILDPMGAWRRSPALSACSWDRGEERRQRQYSSSSKMWL